MMRYEYRRVQPYLKTQILRTLAESPILGKIHNIPRSVLVRERLEERPELKIVRMAERNDLFIDHGLEHTAVDRHESRPEETYLDGFGALFERHLLVIEKEDVLVDVIHPLVLRLLEHDQPATYIHSGHHVIDHLNDIFRFEGFIIINEEQDVVVPLPHEIGRGP